MVKIQHRTFIQSYTPGPGIDEPAAMIINNSTYFYISDIQGSIRAIISADNGSLTPPTPKVSGESSMLTKIA